jgi:hypothetical protein
MSEMLYSNGLVKYRQKYFKPILMRNNRNETAFYFVDIHSGEFISTVPIKLQIRNYATIGELINYFDDSSVEIISEHNYIVKEV